MLRTALLIVLSAFSFAIQFAPVLAQEKDRSKEDPAASLQVGGPAPALKATRWFLGEPVTKFEPEKVYVVCFWATWCPPCIGHMPELAELQARYKDRGVTVIAFTCRGIRGGPDNTEEAVVAFLKKRAKGLRLNYAVAYADDATTADAWLKAAGQDGWCTFVVDEAGRIAFMGSTLFLDVALPKVLAGARPKAVGEEMAKVAAEYKTVMETLVRDFKAGRDLKPDSILRNGNKKSLALAVKAAEAIVRIDGGKDAQSLLNLADAYRVNGDKGRAKEYARRAIEAAAGEPLAFRQDIEKEATRLGTEN
jgi:thiol-disulfide isomerase/thioredoxin